MTMNPPVWATMLYPYKINSFAYMFIRCLLISVSMPRLGTLEAQYLLVEGRARWAINWSDSKRITTTVLMWNSCCYGNSISWVWCLMPGISTCLSLNFPRKKISGGAVNDQGFVTGKEGDD